jgi:beta-mannosidase
VTENSLSIDDLELDSTFEDETGILDARLELTLFERAEVLRAELVVGQARAALACEPFEDGARVLLQGRLLMENARPWWPHTHGEPTLYPASIELELGKERAHIELGKIGFRRLERIGPNDGEFGLKVNGEEIFCRGASWMPLDIATVHAPLLELRRALALVVEAGMNMLRVPGNMAYESDDFYRLCDELGILVWQDFMFANMDYPTDPEFLKSVEREAHQLLSRIGFRPSLAVLCGGSEVAQQAAMMGLPADAWAHPIFDELLPHACSERAPSVPYVPSSPCGGTMPFHVGAGPSHYYGVGAYLRPLEDARIAKVRFASECLAFSNVPEDASFRDWLGGESALAHHPRYKERVPRDGGAGWDFADVTDHYIERLFRVDARQLRYSDHDRYLRLSRVAVVEVMANVQGSFRSHETSCRGSLVWFLRDLWDGAGWGVIDHRGRPKAPWYALRRAWAPLSLWFLDDGVDGLVLHADNEHSYAVRGRLVVELYRPDGAIVERAERDFELGPREQVRHPVEAEIGRFVDSSYAYRFGPPQHSLVVARFERSLKDSSSHPEVLAEAFHLPLGLSVPVEHDLGLRAEALRQQDGSYLVTACADRFAQSVSIEVNDYRPTDAYFHLAPRVPHRFLLVPRPNAGALRGKLRALNATKTTNLDVRMDGES